MSSLFTQQIAARTEADEAMRKKADSMINDAVTRNPSDDVLGGLRTNEEALDRILSLCGIEKEKLNHLEKEDVLFTTLKDDPKWYQEQTGYCLGVTKEGAYIALLPGMLKGYYYLDEKKRKHRVDEKNAGLFEKVYCLCRLLPESRLTIPQLLKYLLSFMRKRALVMFILMNIIAGVLGLVFPRLVSVLLNNAQNVKSSSLRQVLVIALLCVAAELVRLLLNGLIAYFTAVFTNMVSCNVKNAALIRYLSNTEEEPGERKSAATVWTAINTSLPEFVENLVGSGLGMVPYLIFTLCYCWSAWVFLGGHSFWMYMILVLLAIALWIINKGYDLWYKRTVQNRIRGDHVLFQVFKGIEKIRSRQAQKRIYLKWSHIYAEEAACDKQRKKYNEASNAAQDLITPILTAALIVVAMISTVTYSAFMTGTLLAGLLAGQIADLTLCIERVVNSRSLWENVSFLFAAKQIREKKVKCTDFTGSLSVNKLTFAYPGMERLLDEVSFEVKTGEYVGIVGMSGCGKSTLLRLLLGILKPNKGEINYGRYELSGTDQRSLLRNMGIVLQNESLIPGTIRQNMMMQPRPVTEEEIWKTLETVKIADLVRSYPYGLDTEIGTSGATMSGGQMQKLLIARAIISKPKMIVFDEATSALDNVSQREVKEALDAMNCTRIVVAHRLSTVKDCDKIILLEKGHITQEGTYEELVKQEGLFRELVLCQGAEG
ncbi:MAG: ATP-binding cassette domain-containing protein [Lachnospiraceae bacterium]|nr:ATP-binding cassette domain-containing protein [Lachnospiraceae bacterium]